MKNFRYPGAQPFQGSQKNIFFGREKDIEAFYEIMSLEEHLILYSKSGLGKSSLLNAGIIPLILKEKTHLPIPVRFGAFSGEESTLPVETTIQAIRQEISKPTFLEKIIDIDHTLWYYAKSLQLQSSYNGFILIFDQFEELFTYSEKAILDFKQQLSELMHTEIPNRFREIIGRQFQENNDRVLSEEELEQLHHPIEVKVIMSIRSDRMSLLNNLSDHLPNILRTCYELKALNSEHAEEAILNPAYLNDPAFITAPFDYEDEAIEVILNYLTRGRQENIESFQLQILCQALERKVLNGDLSKITVKELENLEHIYENYYEDQIGLLDTAEEKQAARQLIEEGLIFEEEERRLSMYEGQIFRSFGFTPELLNKLVNVHLLRAEPSLKGGYTYELSHDTIVRPILKAKKKRKAEEARQAEETDRKEREQEMAALRQAAALERKKRRRARILAIAGISLALLAIIATIFAVRFGQKARQQVFSLVQADYNRLLAEGKSLQRDGDYQQAILRFETGIEKIKEYDGLIDQGGVQATNEIALTLQLAEKSERFDSLFIVAKDLMEQGAQGLLQAKAAFGAARNLDINPERNRQADLEILETDRTIAREYERLKRIGDRFRAVGETRIACDHYQNAYLLNNADKDLEQLLSRICQ